MCCPAITPNCMPDPRLSAASRGSFRVELPAWPVEQESGRLGMGRRKEGRGGLPRAGPKEEVVEGLPVEVGVESFRGPLEARRERGRLGARPEADRRLGQLREAVCGEPAKPRLVVRVGVEVDRRPDDLASPVENEAEEPPP